MAEDREMGNEDHLTGVLRHANPRGSVAARRALASVEERLFGQPKESIRLSRYVLLDRIAAGGGGVVYEAFDPQLDRKVAIKLLHARDRAGKTRRARLVREAQALARLSHPNVIAVYDVGTYDPAELHIGLEDETGEDTREAGVFIVMELVQGVSLADWLREEPRSWRAVRDVFVAAGRGVAAAHARGLVHRDFKPSNALVGRDGRVRVLDFGLARAVREIEDDASSASGSSSMSLDVALTVTGAVLGTPAYMAPEQHAGRPADERSDQYGFCVALYEGFYGERPFVAETVAELQVKKEAGRIAPQRDDVKLPARLRQVLLRGLRPIPGKRFSSMDELLRELEWDPRIRRRRLAVGALASVTVLAAALAYNRAADNPGEVCEGIDQLLIGAWDGERREAVADAFSATGAPYAEDATTSVASWLDDYSTRWVEMRLEACEATFVHRTQSTELLGLRTGCLDQRLAELGALVDIFVAADREVLRRSTAAASNLRRLERCADTATLSTRLPPPDDPAVAEQVALVRAELARSRAMHGAGRFDAALAASKQALIAARETDYAPVEAEALLLVGRGYQSVGTFEDAEASLSDAYWAAAAASHDEVAALAASELVAVVGHDQGRHDQGLFWGRHAEAAVKRVGLGDVEEARLLSDLGSVLTGQGRYEDAARNHQRALEIRVSVLGETHPEVASSLHGLAAVFEAQAKYEQAVEQHARAHEIRTAALGAGHPAAGTSLSKLGLALERLDRFDEAATKHASALAVWEGALESNDPLVGTGLTNVARAHARAGRHDQAVPQYRRALEVFEARLGAEDPRIAFALTGLGASLLEQGSPTPAQGALERALAIRLASDSEAEVVAKTRFTLARALWDAQGDVERAQSLAKQARAAFAADDRYVRDQRAVDAWLAAHFPR